MMILSDALCALTRSPAQSCNIEHGIAICGAFDVVIVRAVHTSNSRPSSAPTAQEYADMPGGAAIWSIIPVFSATRTTRPFFASARQMQPSRSSKHRLAQRSMEPFEGEKRDDASEVSVIGRERDARR